MVLIFKTLQPLHPWMLYAKCGGNWPNGSGEKDTFSLFSNYLPLDKDMALQTWNPITQGCFVLKLVKIGLVLLEKKNFKFWQYISLEKISLIWKRNHYRCRVALTYILGTHDYWAMRVLKHATPTVTRAKPLWWSSPRTNDTHTYCRAFWQGNCHDLFK